ncbi:MAG: hypothetical protein K0S76_865 [Herbinix sp.]|jgi:uncharacterized protein (TIGR00299 family) protein|nr:hypothetical protein [Herbinix sp.]
MDEKTLYLECYSGISGDMTVAALLDLGADQEILMEGLKSLNVTGYRTVIGRRTKSSLDVCDFDVILEAGQYHEPEHSDDQVEQHSHHDMHDHHHDHDHDHDHHHDQDHHHDHDHHHEDAPHRLGHHEHRNLNHIYKIIDQSSITENAKKLARKIFHIVAVAESKAHGKPIELVHFHEVGAIDSIVDIVATAICLDNLNITKVIVPALYEGSGHITCQHGLLPIPVPAVSNIAVEHQLSLHITNVKGELVTPTGAAIVAAIKTSDTLPREYRMKKIGLGAGKRNYENASGILRAILIEENENTSSGLTDDNVWVLEANIDDCSGEALAYAMEVLLQQGAKDVYYTPIFMKKNRPAYLLGVICDDQKLETMEELIFTNTTTIGIRKHLTERSILKRSQKTITTPYGAALIKLCTYKGKTFYYPEYESIKILCAKSGLNYMSMYHFLQELATK